MYDEKMQEYLERKQELLADMEDANNADENYYESISALLGLVSKSSELFESSNTPQKRRLLSFLFANLEMDGSKLSYTLKTPFHLLVNLADCQEWWAVEDSNFRPLRCQRSALTN